jgi:hypothetical protein
VISLFRRRPTPTKFIAFLLKKKRFCVGAGLLCRSFHSHKEANMHPKPNAEFSRPARPSHPTKIAMDRSAGRSLLQYMTCLHLKVIPGIEQFMPEKTYPYKPHCIFTGRTRFYVGAGLLCRSFHSHSEANMHPKPDAEFSRPARPSHPTKIAMDRSAGRSPL